MMIATLAEAGSYRPGSVGLGFQKDSLRYRYPFVIPFKAADPTAVIHSASLSCQNAGKAQKFRPVRGHLENPDS